MAHSRSAVPKKKRRVHASREPPFPVPIATVTKEAARDDNWFYYTGELHVNHVAIKHSGDMDFLYKMGFFGKGTLSRSKPDLLLRARYVDVPLDSGETTTSRIINRRSYIRHLNWREHSGDGDIYTEYDSSQEQPDSEGTMLCTVPQEIIPEKEEKTETNVFSDQSYWVSMATDDWDKMSTDEELWESGTLQSKEINSVPTKSEEDWAETDEDFWGCSSENTSEKKTGEIILDDTGPEVKTDVKLDNDSENQKPCEERVNVDVHLTCDKNISDCTEENDKNIGETQWKDTDVIAKKYPLDRRKSLDDHSNHSALPTTRSCPEDLPQGKSGVDTVDFSASPNTVCESVCHTCSDGNTESCSMTDKDIHTESTFVPYSDSLDPLCQSNDEDGDILVVEDSDSELYDGGKSQSNSKWMPTLKTDPYNINEYLHLSFEEAFFLCFGLGCLIVKNNGQELGIHSLWRELTQRQKHFLPKYIAYHYFRAKGWVPKSGLKFGSDFILYKVGPPFYHGSYSVIVRMVDQKTLKDDPEFMSRTFSWISLAGLKRATEHVAKELMFCFVIKPTEVSTEDYQSPACISRFRVEEMVVSRWVSSQEREKTAVEEMP